MSRISIAFFVLLCVGCANGPATRAARVGSAQVAALEAALAEKAAAENAYYDGIVDLTARDLGRIRQVEIQNTLDRASRTFAKAHVGAEPDDRLRQDAAKFVTDFVKSWRQSDTAREKARADLLAELDRGRSALAVESKKHRELRAKLTALGESRTPRAMFQFLVKYGKATNTALDELEKAAASAAASAEPGAPEPTP